MGAGQPALQMVKALRLPAAVTPARDAPAAQPVRPDDNREGRVTGRGSDPGLPRRRQSGTRGTPTPGSRCMPSLLDQAEGALVLPWLAQPRSPADGGDVPEVGGGSAPWVQIVPLLPRACRLHPHRPVPSGWWGRASTWPRRSCPGLELARGGVVPPSRGRRPGPPLRRVRRSVLTSSWRTAHMLYHVPDPAWRPPSSPVCAAAASLMAATRCPPT